jgi:DNA polymerase-1
MDTGRLSSGGKNKATKEEYINFQNIPSDKETRACFVAEEGNVLLVSDYSGQEQVVLVNNCLDDNLLKFYDEGLGDMHSFVASKMYKELEGLSLEEIKTKHKEKRQAAKSVGFCANYGGAAPTIAQNLNISVEEGEFIYNSYFEAFPGLKDYFKKVQNQTLSNGYVLISEKTGRKSFIAGYEGYLKGKKKFNKNYWERYRVLKENGSDIFSEMKEEVSKWFRFKGQIERMALNFPIQGQSAEITKIASIYFFNWIRTNNLFGIVKFVNTIHDELVIECPVNISNKTSQALETSMNKAGDLYCKRIRLTAVPEKTLYWKK